MIKSLYDGKRITFQDCSSIFLCCAPLEPFPSFLFLCSEIYTTEIWHSCQGHGGLVVNSLFWKFCITGSLPDFIQDLSHMWVWFMFKSTVKDKTFSCWFGVESSEGEIPSSSSDYS
ncbi:hypothetical protein AVEN_226311-1 [Araneus ventricosus]|uniref:Uncharacterized protein n=1 Tax=Araneus ventricosus TaxID=182803 RepID=A0A4Y2D977_ARAVE|nr:hypothetical protein AVEN_226311-1 [Araneus ventricosus]